MHPEFRDRISVVIPTYNRAHALCAVLDSIAAQSLPVREIVLVDDGSTDRTADVAELWRKRNPLWKTRLRFLQQTNQGKSVALNRGLQDASGDWIAYNDSDDIWLPTKLERQALALRQFPSAAACFTDARFVNDPAFSTTALHHLAQLLPAAAGLISDTVDFVLEARGAVYMQTILVRRDVMATVGSFDPRLRVAQDRDFVFRLALHTPFCCVNVPLVEIDRTVGRQEGLVSKFDHKALVRLQAHEVMLLKWLELLGSGGGSSKAEASTQVSRLLRSSRSAQVNRHLTLGDPAAAVSCLRRELYRRFSAALGLKLILVALAPKIAVRYSRRFYA